MMSKRGIIRSCCTDCPRRSDCCYREVKEPARCPVIRAVFKARAATGGMGSVRQHFRQSYNLYGYLIIRRLMPFPPLI